MKKRFVLLLASVCSVNWLAIYATFPRIFSKAYLGYRALIRLLNHSRSLKCLYVP